MHEAQGVGIYETGWASSQRDAPHGAHPSSIDNACGHVLASKTRRTNLSSRHPRCSALHAPSTDVIPTHIEDLKVLRKLECSGDAAGKGEGDHAVPF